MSIETNLIGRLRNTHLPLNSGLLPLFEAVVNSIEAIDEANLPSGKGRISIRIDRVSEAPRLGLEDPDRRRGPEPKPDIRGFTITDNGIGFNQANYQAFKTLDTDHKATKGCKGIGRLLWLKAFKKVFIESRYLDDARLSRYRSFSFGPTTGVYEEHDAPGNPGEAQLTSVALIGFEEKYRKVAYKNAQSIGNAILEHCIWYFIRSGGAPHITVEDTDEFVDLNESFLTHMHSSAVVDSFLIKGSEFDLIHLKRRTTLSSINIIAYCADNRLVSEEKIDGKVPGLHGRLSDDQGEFIYQCYVSSKLLNEAVRPERTGFDIDSQLGDLFSESEVSWEEIRIAVREKVAEHLAGYLEKVRERAKERVQKFVSTVAPRYRPIISKIPETELNIDPEISDKDLDITLHRHLADIESKLLRDGHDLMTPRPDEGESDYNQRLQAYLKNAEDIKKSDLANYVSHRKVILDLLDSAIQRRADGTYAREDSIHSLIMPMRTTTNDVLFDGCNLWLIDEHLAFHDYLASDKPLSTLPITGDDSNKEPDIIALNIFNKPILVSENTAPPLASLVVIEIKRPMRNDAGPGEKDDPIEQALGYLDRVRAGKVVTATGRPIPKYEDIPGYCYIICDLTPSVEQRIKLHDLIRTSDGMGYFGYKSSYKAYIEVMSFDRLVNSAKQRNRAFFDKLGLPIF